MADKALMNGCAGEDPEQTHNSRKHEQKLPNLVISSLSVIKKSEPFLEARPEKSK